MKALARKELGKLSRRDIWILGMGLYIGEGTKLQETVKVINANPDVIKMAITWLHEVCGVDMENFSIRIHMYPDNDLIKTINYWSKVASIPRRQFKKSYVDRRINKKIGNRGKLPYGTAHLMVKAMGKKEFGVQLHRRIMGWIEATVKQMNAGVVQW